MSADPFVPPERSATDSVATLAQQSRRLLALLRRLLFVVLIGGSVLSAARGIASASSVVFMGLLAWSFAAPLRRQARALDRLDGGDWDALWDLAVGHLRLVRWLAILLGLFCLAMLGTP